MDIGPFAKNDFYTFESLLYSILVEISFVDSSLVKCLVGIIVFQLLEECHC